MYHHNVCNTQRVYRVANGVSCRVAEQLCQRRSISDPMMVLGAPSLLASAGGIGAFTGFMNPASASEARGMTLGVLLAASAFDFFMRPR